MRRLLLAILLSAAVCGAQELTTGPIKPTRQASSISNSENTQITIPAGTTVPLALTRAVWAKTAAPGDSVYAETVFPVAIDNQMAIPAGTYAQGQIDAISRPGIFSPHAQIQIHFTKLIFANGYTVVFGEMPSAPTAAAATQRASNSANDADVIPAVSSAYVEVSGSSDVLLDNGTQIEMVLQKPLDVDRALALDAAKKSSPVLAAFKTASLCRPTPGTPGTQGTSDTVIPGSPGTPDTVIPGAPGQPDIVIPGTPATPDTVIPGTPGTPGTPGVACPGPPVATSSPKQYKGNFQLDARAVVYSQTLAAGGYQVSWVGLDPVVVFEIAQKNNEVMRGSARLLLLNKNSPANDARTSKSADGTLTLESLRFAGQNVALCFDVKAQ